MGSGDDGETIVVYAGEESCCQVVDLLPGRTYLFQVRAADSQGVKGAWSSCLDLVSGPGCPGEVQPPSMIATSSSTILVTWENPVNNGATITGYKLMMGFLEELDNEDDDEEEEEEEEDIEAEINEEQGEAVEDGKEGEREEILKEEECKEEEQVGESDEERRLSAESAEALRIAREE